MRVLIKTKSDTIMGNMLVKMRNVPNTQHIRKHKIGYEIFKELNGKYTYLGRGKTLIIALMKRDWCEANNWKPYPSCFKYIKKNHNGNYIIIKNNNNKLDSYGTFKTLKDAQKEVELLKRCNWDIEAVCNLDERINGKTIFKGYEMYE